MLLEQLVKKAAQPAKYDWESYYRWFFCNLTDQEVTDFRVWLCEECQTVNILFLPARYGKCRGCQMIYLPSGSGGRKA